MDKRISLTRGGSLNGIQSVEPFQGMISLESYYLKSDHYGATIF